MALTLKTYYLILFLCLLTSLLCNGFSFSEFLKKIEDYKDEKNAEGVAEANDPTCNVETFEIVVAPDNCACYDECHQDGHVVQSCCCGYQQWFDCVSQDCKPVSDFEPDYMSQCFRSMGGMLVLT